jgi:hypothetical protein
MLSQYLSQLLGEDCPRIEETQPFDGYGFFIGKTAAFDTSEVDGKTNGSYFLTPFDKGLAIYGAGSRGTIYGVCGFLMDYCGYRFFSVYTGMSSSADTVSLPEKKVQYEPYFEFTDTDWRSPWDPLYSMMNGLNSGSHRNLTSAQGGDIDAPFPKAKTVREIRAKKDGYISHMDAETVGRAACEVGAGRKTKDDKIDFAAGIVLRKKTGDFVRTGEVLAVIHTSGEEKALAGEKIFRSALEFAADKPVEKKLIIDIVR